MLLNHILSTFMDPTSFVSNRQLLSRFKFEKEHVLSHIVQTYVNLDVTGAYNLDFLKVRLLNSERYPFFQEIVLLQSPTED